MRRSPRLPHFDYSTPAAYFVTIATHERLALFGAITPDSDSVQLNAAGRMVEYWWGQTSQKFEGVTPDAACVMPDHFHALLLLHCKEQTDWRSSLSRVLQWFKTMTTNAYFRGVRDQHWIRVAGHVWQRSFYDRIVRNEREFDQIRWHIEANPGKLYERMFG